MSGKRKPGNVAPKKPTPTQQVVTLRFTLAAVEAQFEALTERQADLRERYDTAEKRVDELLRMLRAANDQAHDLSMAKAASATLLHTAPGQNENGGADNMEQWTARFNADQADAEEEEELKDHAQGFTERYNEIHGEGIPVEEMIRRRKKWEEEQNA